MPQMGESIAEGTVTNWLKKVGERVERDEPLFEISTDKVDAEIPSPAAGTLLEVKVQPGQTVPINTVVAIVGEDGAGAHAPAVKAEPQLAPKTPERAGPVSPEDEEPHLPPAALAPPPAPPTAEAVSLEERRRTKSSPVVRKIAAEHGIDISQLTGTGIGGRVTKDDILGFIESGAEQPAPARRAASAMAAALAPTAELRGLVPDAYRGRVLAGDRVEEMSTMRAKIAEHMVMSRRISAHVQTVWDVDFSRVASLRQKHKGAWQERTGQNLTYTAFIAKAAVDALKSFPIVNASLDDNRVIYHRNVNLGMAVALDWGLIVPVVQRADELNLLGLSRRLSDLAERARGKKLKPDEVQNGTFTITNPGVFGPLFGLPIINQPQVAIMGVGAVEKRPVVLSTPEGDAIGIRTKAYLSLSFDHRVIDGAVADQFMARVKKNIEEFDEAELG